MEAFRNPDEPIEEAVDLTPEELIEPEIKQLQPGSRPGARSRALRLFAFKIALFFQAPSRCNI